MAGLLISGVMVRVHQSADASEGLYLEARRRIQAHIVDGAVARAILRELDPLGALGLSVEVS